MTFSIWKNSGYPSSISSLAHCISFFPTKWSIKCASNPSIAQLSHNHFARLNFHTQKRERTILSYLAHSSYNLSASRSSCLAKVLFPSKETASKSISAQSIASPNRDDPSASVTAVIFFILGVLGIVEYETRAETRDRELDRAKLLLEKKPIHRTLEEQIELFNFLVSRGEQEVKKAANKDVVIFFGNSDAGKSTLLNFLYGCSMKRTHEGKIIVDPQSPIKEVAEIGTKTHSCTFLPQKIPDILIPDPNAEGEIRKLPFSFYDMPGLSDDRGIEVAIANAIVMKKLVTHAKSARFVLVLEQAQLELEHGRLWKETVESLQKRFNNTVGLDQSSLCVIVTKNFSDLATIKTKMNQHLESMDHPLDLSQIVTVYDPLDPGDRERLYQNTLEIRPYEKLATQISLRDEQLWKALELGDQIKAKVTEHLEKKEMEQAVKKVEFTHHIAKLENPALSKSHEIVSNAVIQYVKKITDSIDSRKTTHLSVQIGAYEEFKTMRERFIQYVDFSELNKEVQLMIQCTKDPRWASWEKSHPTGVSAGFTLVLGVGAAWFLSLALAVGGIGTILATGYSAKRWLMPSKSQKKIDHFFGEIQ